MEDWLEVGGPKAMLFWIREAVPIWKEERKIRQKVLQDAILHEVDDTQFDLEDYSDNEL
jgi:hypothetical protein